MENVVMCQLCIRSSGRLQCVGRKGCLMDGSIHCCPEGRNIILTEGDEGRETTTGAWKRREAGIIRDY